MGTPIWKILLFMEKGARFQPWAFQLQRHFAIGQTTAREFQVQIEDQTTFAR